MKKFSAKEIRMKLLRLGRKKKSIQRTENSKEIITGKPEVRRQELFIQNSK